MHTKETRCQGMTPHGKEIIQKEIVADRPLLRDDPDKQEFFDLKDDTRYYKIGTKTYVADIYDKLMGISRKKEKILPQNKRDAQVDPKTGRKSRTKQKNARKII